MTLLSRGCWTARSSSPRRPSASRSRRRSSRTSGAWSVRSSWPRTGRPRATRARWSRWSYHRGNDVAWPPVDAAVPFRVPRENKNRQCGCRDREIDRFHASLSVRAPTHRIQQRSFRRKRSHTPPLQNARMTYESRTSSSEFREVRGGTLWIRVVTRSRRRVFPVTSHRPIVLRIGGVAAVYCTDWSSRFVECPSENPPTRPRDSCRGPLR